MMYLDSQAVADRLGVKKQTVHQYVSDGKMPPPDMVFGRTKVWRKATIEQWLKRRGQ